VSISPTFHKQLLLAQIPKAQKDDNFNVFFVLLGSGCVKAAHRMLMKLTLGVNFTNILQASF